MNAARCLALAAACVAITGCGTLPPVGDAVLDGATIADVEIRPDVTITVIEYREVGGAVHLLPSAKHYAVSLVTRAPVAVLESQLPLSATASRFTVGAQNGRTFQRCLLTHLGSEGARNRYRLVYTFRCEDVTP